MNFDETPSIAAIRRILLAALTLGLLGTGAELLLLDHVEQIAQWAPVALVFAALAAIGWYLIGGGSASLRLLQVLMIVSIIAGPAGFYFHYRGSAEFKLESNPSLAGWNLFWAALRSKAPPPLAPGIMTQLGLIGLAFAYRHPVFKSFEKEN